MSCLERAAERLTVEPGRASKLLRHLRDEMTFPNESGAPRVYHTETHIEAVLARLFEWTDDAPSPALLAAALYHDAVYDATRGDNELRSAVFCHDELLGAEAEVSDIVRATSIILTTAHHQPNRRNRDEVLLIDADLYVLGVPATEYDAYVAAVRREYRHVADEAWRVGRPAVLRSFLDRERVYQGDWAGRDEHEARARANMAREIESLL